jgi:hypothetical protein
MRLQAASALYLGDLVLIRRKANRIQREGRRLALTMGVMVLAVVVLPPGLVCLKEKVSHLFPRFSSRGPLKL